MDMNEMKAVFVSIVTILDSLSPEGRDAWLKQGDDMARSIATLKAAGYNITKEG